MARPKKETGEPKEANIQNLAELKAEYVKGKMPERKLIALRLRLTELFSAGSITGDEQGLMELILKRLRAIGQIPSSDEYMLSEIEMGRCEEKCIVKSADAPQTHFLSRGLVCSFERDLEKGRFVVFVPRVIPSNHQYSVALAEKINMGHPVGPEEMPKPRTLIKRLDLTGKEFDRWFDVKEDLLNGEAGKEVEEKYTF